MGNAERGAQEAQPRRGAPSGDAWSRDCGTSATLPPSLPLPTGATPTSQCAPRHAFAALPSTPERQRDMFACFEFCCLRKLPAKVRSVQ